MMAVTSTLGFVVDLITALKSAKRNKALANTFAKEITASLKMIKENKDHKYFDNFRKAINEITLSIRSLSKENFILAIWNHRSNEELLNRQRENFRTFLGVLNVELQIDHKRLAEKMAEDLETLKNDIIKLLQEKGMNKILSTSIANKQISCFLKRKNNSTALAESDFIPFDDIDITPGDFINKGEFGERRKGSWLKKKVDIEVIEINKVSASAIKYFERSPRILKMVDHEFILKFWGMCHAGNLYCIVTEPSSRLLSSALKDKSLSKNTRKRVLLDVLAGMIYLHELNIIHRGLRPNTVYLNEHNRPKIASLREAKASDSGISTIVNTEGSTTSIVWQAFEERIEGKSTKYSDSYRYAVFALCVLLNMPDVPKKISDQIIKADQENKHLASLFPLGNIEENHYTLALMSELQKNKEHRENTVYLRVSNGTLSYSVNNGDMIHKRGGITRETLGCSIPTENNLKELNRIKIFILNFISRKGHIFFLKDFFERCLRRNASRRYSLKEMSKLISFYRPQDIHDVLRNEGNELWKKAVEHHNTSKNLWRQADKYKKEGAFLLSKQSYAASIKNFDKAKNLYEEARKKWYQAIQTCEKNYNELDYRSLTNIAADLASTGKIKVNHAKQLGISILKNTARTRAYDRAIFIVAKALEKGNEDSKKESNIWMKELTLNRIKNNV